MQRRTFIGLALSALGAMGLVSRVAQELPAGDGNTDYVFASGPMTVTLPAPSTGQAVRITNTGGQVLTVVDAKGRYHHLQAFERRSF